MVRLDHALGLTEVVCFGFAVLHGGSPLVKYSVPNLGRRKVDDGCGYALTRSSRWLRADKGTAAASSSPRLARSRSQYSSEIVHNTRTREVLFPARVSLIVFSS